MIITVHDFKTQDIKARDCQEFEASLGYKWVLGYPDIHGQILSQKSKKKEKKKRKENCLASQ